MVNRMSLMHTRDSVAKGGSGPELVAQSRMLKGKEKKKWIKAKNVVNRVAQRCT